VVADVVFLLTVVAFFALAALYVHACGWLVGAETAEPFVAIDDGGEEVTA
jgi:hypothetical protein